jgi:hypothetical protein
VVVLEVFLPFDGIDGVDHTLPTEVEPFGEAVVGLHLVRGGRDLLPQLGVAQVLEQEHRPDHPPELAEGLVQPIAATIGAQAAQ